MIIKSDKELEILRECGRRLARILDSVAREVRPGVSTKELDQYAERLIRDAGGAPVFKGYVTLGSKTPYPGSLCVSVNDEVVHAIPSDKKIVKAGDLVGLDIGMRYPAEAGLITDMAITVGVGSISQKAEWLIAATREALEKAVTMLRPGIRLGDLGATVQQLIEKRGFGVVRDLAGHGVGRELHEEPFVPNWGRRGSGPFVHEGSVLAIEPMATERDSRVRLDPDGWTFRTRDGGLAAHFEHTVIVLKDGAEALTKL